MLNEPVQGCVDVLFVLKQVRGVNEDVIKSRRRPSPCGGGGREGEVIASRERWSVEGTGSLVTGSGAEDARTVAYLVIGFPAFADYLPGERVGLGSGRDWLISACFAAGEY